MNLKLSRTNLKEIAAVGKRFPTISMTEMFGLTEGINSLADPHIRVQGNSIVLSDGVRVIRRLNVPEMGQEEAV